MVVIYDLFDGGEWDFDYLAVGSFDLDAGRCQGLSRFHAADDAAHALAVLCHDFYIVLTIEGAQGSEGFGYFHFFLPCFLKARRYWRRTIPCLLS